MDDRLYLRQLAAGRDFGTRDPVARQMQNFVYLVGDKETRETLVVDPAWDVDGIVACAQADGYRVAGALVTHWHPDHVGGPLMGHDVQGLARLIEVAPCPIHVHAGDAELVKLLTGVSDSDLVLVSSGDKVKVGAVEVECLHTPGHTAGSQCFRCGQALISGDTLFLEGCGRTDLPGGDAQVLARSLGALMGLPSDLVLYPGHDYSDRPSAPLDEVKRTNPVLQGFLRRFGAA